jgi:type I restriction enzyme S subunit
VVNRLCSIEAEGWHDDPHWLGYWLGSSFFNERKDSLCTGATQKAITNDAIRELEIPLPPPSEQERIVRILDEAAALRRLRLDADTKSRALIESLYLRTFCRAENRQAWTAESVGAIAEQRDGSIRTGPFGSQLLHSEFIETGVPVLGIENVVTNDFRWTAPRCLSLAKYRQFERFRVFPGDVLVTIMGTVGRCSVAPDDLPLCMSTKHLCVITPDRTKVHPRFLWAALLFDPAIRQQTASVGGGAIMEGWNSTIIRQLTLHVPPLELQNEFANLTAEARELEAAQSTSRQRFDDLFQSLLHRAFQGGL